MRRIALIATGAVVLVWGALALALDSASLRLAPGSKRVARVSPDCLPTSLEHSAALAGTGVAMSPAPESVSANPHSQISFLGAPASELQVLSVVGSKTGSHTGSLRAYSQGDGASFAPSVPFAAGESVSVRAALGAGGGTPLAFRFRVDTPYSTTNTTDFANLPAAPADYQSFYTQPGMQAPVLTVTTPDRDPAAGDVFTTNGPGPGQYGPLIYAPSGRLVWFDQMPEGVAAEDFSQQTYEGRPVLTWWKGHVLELGFGLGEDVVMDSHYATIAHVAGGNGLEADLHDFQLAPDGVAYITAYNPIRCNLEKIGGNRGGAIVDTAVQEIDMRSGLVRWEWHSLDHVGTSESEVEVPKDTTPWDYFHLNSIDPESGGRILVSARSTWAAYLLDTHSGSVLWRLGGSKSSFKMGPGTKMAWQHDGRVLPDGELTFFDDGSNPPIHRESRGLRVKLDPHAHEASLVASYTHANPPVLTASQGNMQTLSSDNVVVGYGGVPQVSEYSKSGALLFDAHQPFDMSFYRAYRFPWSGQPLTPPSVAASFDDTEEETIVHASWNGATAVASWRILGGAQSSALKAQATIPAAGFESSTQLRAKFPYVAVQALDGAGHVLGTSKTVTTTGFAASLPNEGRTR